MKIEDFNMESYAVNVENNLVLALVKEISEEVRAEIKRAVAEAIREELLNDSEHLSRL